MFAFESGNEWSKTEAFLRGTVDRSRVTSVLHKYGQIGVDALKAATPTDSGESANAWSYQVTSGLGGFSIVWRNSHMAGTTPVVILLQYGHATRNGGYVQGRDFITSTIRPIFDTIEAEILKVVAYK